MTEIKKIFQDTEELMKKTLEKTKSELSMIRSGRADVSMLENIKVQYYNTLLPLKQVAAISIPEPKTMDIKPWDKSVLPAIEKAIYQSSLGLTPVNDGTKIRLNIPPLTEERKREVIKSLHALVESFKTSIRNERRMALEKIRKLEHEKKISKDDKFRAENDLQKLTNTYIQKIDDLAKQKENEIIKS
jgi:ribosome recycling factor